MRKKNRLHINLLNREIIQDYFQQDFLYALVTDTTEYLHYKFFRKLLCESSQNCPEFNNDLISLALNVELVSFESLTNFQKYDSSKQTEKAVGNPGSPS